MTCAGEVHRAWRALPELALDAVCGAGDPLVLAPHPDDESLGCGGLIARAVAAGRAPLVVVLTDGAGSHPGSATYPAARLRALREAETLDAVRQLGLAPDRVVFLGEPDTRAPRDNAGLDAVAVRLCALVERHRCTALLASWEHDPHCDHLAADRAARLAAARAEVPHWSYPVWGWTLRDDVALPDAAVVGGRLDVRAHLDARRRAVAAHRSQHGQVVRDDPGGFVLPRALLHHFEGPWEVFLRPGPEPAA
jgi:LmbE family N-acetylglucosaminyl deacetylase